MEKLLHERLRESRIGEFGRERTWNQQASLIAQDMNVRKEYLLDAIADEIERYYIPIPRDENGKPISKGCEVEGGTVNRYGIYDDGYFSLYDYGGNLIQYGHIGERIKLPKPKVLDADGVEIYIGDTVFWKCSSTGKIQKYTVDRIEFDKSKSSPIQVWNVNGHWMPPDKLTHKEPVLDADDIPINVDDTVWVAETGCMGVVTKVNETTIDVQWSDGDMSEYVIPRFLTHKKPDSLGRIHADIYDYVSLNMLDDTSEGEYLKQIAERIALIERGA